MKKRGRICVGVLYDLNDLLIFLTDVPYVLMLLLLCALQSGQSSRCAGCGMCFQVSVI